MLRITIVLISVAYGLGFTPDCAQDGILADPQNCSVFYACANGVAFPTACAEGLDFNPVTLVCDWPESAGCSIQTTEPSPSICQDANNTLVPDPENCAGFYACDNGKEVALLCPSSLHFNPTLQACDLPETAGCASNSSDIGRCSASNEGAYRAHEEDCKQFYVCSQGVWHNFSCPNDTHFNSKLGVCDWPKHAGCQVNKTIISSVCEGVTPGEFELVSDPEDCSKFYSCVDGTPVSMDCPDKLHFNHYNQTCDWPDNVGCEQERTTTELYP